MDDSARARPGVQAQPTDPPPAEPGEPRRRRSLRERPPFNWPRRRKLRWAVGLVLLLAAYPVLGTLALWTGFAEWVLKSEDLRVEITNPSYTVLPGRVRLKHVRILANGTTQFILDGADLAVDFRMLELLRRRVHVTELAAHDVSYQMRVQVKDKRGIERRLAAYPPLHDLPGANVVHEPTAKKTEKNNPDWTVHVEGLDVAVKELWFFEYRYLGKGYLRGGFMVGPHVMQVSTAVQDVGPGEVRFGADTTIAKDLNGQITADIPQLDPTEHADAGFMQLVTARVRLRTDVQSLVNVGAYFPGIEVTQGRGPLALDLYLDRGKLGSKSELDYETGSLRVKGDGFGVASDAKLKFDAAGSPEKLPVVRMSATATYVSLSRAMRSFTVQIHEHREEARLDTIQLSRATDLKHAELRMPKIVSVDLRDLPVLLPEGVPVEVAGGDARGSLSLDMDEKYWVRGPFALRVGGLDLKASDMRGGGDAELRADVLCNPKLETYGVRSLAFMLRNANLDANDRSIRGYWLNLDGRDLSYKAGTHARFEGGLSVRARDLSPLLNGLADQKKISGIIPALTRLADFRASATIRTQDSITDVVLSSESAVWDVAGRVYKKGDRSYLAVVVGGQAVSLGVADLGHGLELMPFAKTEWLNQHLREFPKPIVELRGKTP